MRIHFVGVGVRSKESAQHTHTRDHSLAFFRSSPLRRIFSRPKGYEAFTLHGADERLFRFRLTRRGAVGVVTRIVSTTAPAHSRRRLRAGPHATAVTAAAQRVSRSPARAPACQRRRVYWRNGHARAGAKMVRWVNRPRTLARKLALVWCELPPQRPAAGEIKLGHNIALAADA